MRGLLRTFTLATAAAMAAVASFLLLTLPPASLELGHPLSPLIASGAIHIHTSRSDGTGSVDDVAEAASRAGLQFVVITDHGDGTFSPLAPAYRHGVLCIDAVEISTDDGHLLAIGLTRPSPYPLAGRGRDVVADIHRMGGVAVAAHPDSPKPDLRWRAMGAPIDGIEWLNADSEWRDERPLHLMAMGVRSLVRPAESVAAMFQQPTRTFQRWDQLLRSRRVFGLAGVDAHASIPWRETDEPRQRSAIARPTYEAMFRTLVQGVVLEAPLTGDATTDARAVLGAITGGRSYSVVRAFAWPASMTFAAAVGDRIVPMGGEVAAPSEGAAFISAAVPEAPGVNVTILRNGRPEATAPGRVRLADPVPGAYRAVASLPGSEVPWIVSNAIRILPAGSVPSAGTNAADAANATEFAPPAAWHVLPLDAGHWTVEHEASSRGDIAQDGSSVRFTYQLGAGDERNQYAAFVTPVTTKAGADRITFRGYATRPMRVSVQVRLAGPRAPRWRASVYLDQNRATRTVRVEDLEPADGGPTTRRPVVVPLDALLFVVDTVNSTPGATGDIVIEDVRVGVAMPAN